MSSRLSVLARHLTAAPADSSSTPAYDGFPHATTAASFPPAVHDALGLDELLTEEERDIKRRVRAFAEKELAPVIAGFWERADFPHQLVPKLAALGIGGGTLRGHGCPGHSVTGAAMAVVELSRVDASFCTFAMVHNSLAMLTIGLLGSERQKAELLPDLAAFRTVGAWGLTEPSHGSDAAALQTTARQVDGGWVLNGRKRWIGNATFADVVVIWARNTATQQVNAFVVRRGNPGMRTSKIENKIALRVVQNADIRLTECRVPEADRLPGVESFQDTNKVLATSRVMVAWQPVGVAMGVFDMAVRYTSQRQQFGAPLGAFQLVQEKLARMQGSCQAMFLLALRLSRLAEKGAMTHEQASMCKAWTTLRGREVVALAREVLGGNGVVSDFLVAKAFCDMEAIYSYEGTYEVNALVAGRGITHLAAFKPGPSRKASKQQQQQPPDVQA